MGTLSLDTGIYGDLQADIQSIQMQFSINWLSGAKLYDQTLDNELDAYFSAGNGKSVIVGDDGQTLVGGNGNDVLVAGDGNLCLTGGNGSDLFVFNFAFQQTDGETLLFKDGDHPAANANANAWNNYLGQLADWRADQIDTYGPDQDTSTITVGSRTFDNSFDTAGMLSVSGVGNATIKDFTCNDFVLMRGITQEMAQSLFDNDFFHLTADATGNTQITWGSGADAGGITIIGLYDTTVEQLMNNSHIVWDQTVTS